MEGIQGETISTTQCPSCAAAGQRNFIRNRSGNFMYYCNQNHSWNDSELLQGAVTAARQRWPDLYRSSGTPNQPTTPPPAANDRIIIDVDNRVAIEELIGKVSGPAEIKSALLTMRREIIDLTQLAQQHASVADGLRRQAAGGSVGRTPSLLREDQVIFTIPEFFVGGVQAEAEHEQKSVQEYLQGVLEQYVMSMFVAPRTV